MSPLARSLRITVDDTHVVSSLLWLPEGATRCLVLAHGAGAGMAHAFMASVAEGLAARAIATLRYQFPSMEAGSRRPDRPALAQATTRAAVVTASREMPGMILFAGGKSFGGRMTSQAQAEAPLAGVRGLVFLGFPLHPAGKPSIARAAHLSGVQVPMLFLQGDRDALADMPLLTGVIGGLADRARLIVLEGADHSFHVPARLGRSDAETLARLLDPLAAWLHDPRPVAKNGR